MRYVSTNSTTAPVDLKEAVNRCVAADGGMFMPAELPLIPKAYFNNIGEMTLREIAFVVANSFFGQDIDSATLKSIVDESFAFDAPMHLIGDDTYVLELFHGPTLTFKDYGARFMARLMRAIDANASYRRNVLVATTGNTGAAAANGLFKLDGISVTVLYPKGQLTRAQTAQMTALGENIHPIEIAGTVEDCKRLVQSAIADPALNDYHLTGANSINIARLLPQITFSLYAYAHLKALDVHGAENACYAMPAGNISNVVAAAMAKRIGCPMGTIIAATASNNQLSAPDGISDQVIADTINGLRSLHGYTIDPHGAVAYAAMQGMGLTGVPKVVFATGHPAKQLDIMTRITGAAIEMPHQLTRFMSVKRNPTIIPPTLPALKRHLHSIN